MARLPSQPLKPISITVAMRNISVQEQWCGKTVGYPPVPLQRLDKKWIPIESSDDIFLPKTEDNQIIKSRRIWQPQLGKVIEHRILKLFLKSLMLRVHRKQRV